MTLNDASLWAVIIGGSTAFIGAMYATGKWARPRWRAFRRKATAAVDSLVGREAISDPITGKELAPALPGMGQRMASTEEKVDRLTEAVAAIATAHTRLDGLEHQVATNTDRLSALERAQMERIATRAENAAAMTMIDKLHGQPES